MKKKILISSIVLTTIIIIGAAPERSSSGAPGAHTGAPGEQTCATVGCHDDNSLDAGSASLSIVVGDSITNYVPGQTYAVKVRISDPGINRFGFQLLALDNVTSASTGSFQILDPVRTQAVQNPLVFADRDYITYTFKGTDIVAPGMSEWTVNWTAPASGGGTVSFYAAGVSANDDMTDQGDHVYTASKVISN